MNNINPRTGVAYDTSTGAKLEPVTKEPAKVDAKVEDKKEEQEAVDPRSEKEFLETVSQRLKSAQTSNHPITVVALAEAIDTRLRKISSGHVKGAEKKDPKAAKEPVEKK